MARFAAALALAALTSAGLARAQNPNLVSNAHFDTTIFGPWSNGWYGSREWTNMYDHHGSGSGTTSGSAMLTATNQSASTLYQCVAVSAGTAYDFGVWAIEPSYGESCPGYSRSTLTWYSGADCSTGQIATVLGVQSASTNIWENLANLGKVAPSGTIRALIVVMTYCPNPTGSYYAYLDDAYVSCSSADGAGPAVTPPAGATVLQTVCQ